MGFNIKDDILISYTEESGVTEVVIPDGISRIEDNAFKNCCRIEKVIISEGVKIIGKESFYNCRGLEEISFPESLTVIGDYAFDYCNKIKEIIIPKNVTKIGWSAFSGCSNLEYVQMPEYITEIECYTFSLCEKLKNIKLPDKLEKIGAHAFYKCGNLRELILPESVKSIGNSAFFECWCLASVNIPKQIKIIEEKTFYHCGLLEKTDIPEGVTSIGDNAFSGCKKTEKIFLPESLETIGKEAFNFCDGITEIKIPEKVTVIEDGTFYGCNNLEKVVLHDNITSIGKEVFHSCDKLREIEWNKPRCRFGKDSFDYYGKFVVAHLEKWIDLFDESDLRTALLFNQLDDFFHKIIIKRYTKKISSVFAEKITAVNADSVCKNISAMINGKISAKECNNAAAFTIDYITVLSGDSVIEIYNNLKSVKNGQKAVATMEANEDVLKKLNFDDKAFETDKLHILVNKNGMTVPQLEDKLKNMYSLQFKNLPNMTEDGGEYEKKLLAAVLIFNDNDKLETDGDVLSIINDFDQNAFQSFLKNLINFVWQNNKYGSADIAYPVCRFANEELMKELIAYVPRFVTATSGIWARMIREFRGAVSLSSFKISAEFADKYDCLEKYAQLREYETQTYRDLYLSDVPLDENGEKKYDLGNITVTVKLNSELNLDIIVPGKDKMPKSLPKKGADPEKYEAAVNDLKNLKARIKYLIKRRKDNLIEGFINGKGQESEIWQKVYLKNSVLRLIAGLVVWHQGDKTFTLGENGAVTSEGSDYIIDSNEIRIAHPVDMEKSDILAWQKYFTSKSLKQPFLQIWEPKYNVADIETDRYKGCMIPYYRFKDMEKQGIRVSGYYDVSISFEDCQAEVERHDVHHHELLADDRFEVESFSVEKITRQSNHIIFLLDNWTIYNHIVSDNAVKLKSMLNEYNIAQIDDFIKAASENSALNVTALLLTYKEEHFDNFDPMEIYTLD